MKIKHDFEQWLRAVVADEVSKLDVSLQREKNVFNAQLRALDEAVKHLAEVQENAKLREHIQQLTAGLSGVSSTVNKLFSPK